MSGTLFVVATPIGNLEDVTARALRVLREVAVIAAEDTRRTSHLLARYAIPTTTTSLHEHNEAKKTPALIARLMRGENVALVSDAGTPTIADPGHRLIGAALDAGIRVEPVPGPNAAIATLAVSGFPGDSFAFLGFPPTRSKDRIAWFSRVKSIGGVVVFYEAPHRIRRTLSDLQRAVGDCRIVVGRELTKAHEELVRGPISEVLEALHSELGEFTVVADIGHLIDVDVNMSRDPTALQSELDYLTEYNALTTRAAISVIAKRHNIRPNAVYQLLHQSRKSVK